MIRPLYDNRFGLTEAKKILFLFLVIFPKQVT